MDIRYQAGQRDACDSTTKKTCAPRRVDETGSSPTKESRVSDDRL